MAAKNTWFKHYNTASQGHLVGNLIAEKNYAAIALWWAVLELVSQCESPEQRGTARVPIARIARAVNMKPSRIERLLTHISLVSQSDLECDLSEKQTGYVTFRLRKWAELQERRGGKRLPKIDQNSDRGKKREVRAERESSRSFEELFESIPLATQTSLKAAYSDEFIKTHGPLCVAYFQAREPAAVSWNGTFWGIKLADWLARERKGLAKAKASEYGGWAERDGVG